MDLYQGLHSVLLLMRALYRLAMTEATRPVAVGGGVGVVTDGKHSCDRRIDAEAGVRFRAGPLLGVESWGVRRRVLWLPFLCLGLPVLRRLGLFRRRSDLGGCPSSRQQGLPMLPNVMEKLLLMQDKIVLRR